jgi:hypothetical protein
METRSDDLIEAMRRLEGDHRRLKRGCSIGLLLSLLLIGSGAHFAAGPNVLEAERLVIRDKEGKARFTLGIEDDGFGGLALRDENERTRIRLGLRPDGSTSLIFSDTKSQRLLGVVLDRDDRPGIGLRDPEGGVNRLSLGLNRDGSTGFTIFDRSKVERLSVGVHADGAPAVNLRGEAKNCITMMCDSKGSNGLQMKGRDGTVRTGLGIRPDGLTNLYIRDSLNEDRVKVFVTGDDAAGVALWDKTRGSIAMTAQKDGAKCFDISDNKNNSLIKIGVPVEGHPCLMLHDQAGKILHQAPAP